MYHFLFAALFAVFSLDGILLRYAPFHGEITAQKRKQLWGAYAAALAACMLVIFLAVHIYGISFFIAKAVYFLMPVVLVLINMLVIRGRVREHLFVYGIVAVCNYTLSAIPTYLVSTLLDIELARRMLMMLLFQLALQWAGFWFFRKVVVDTVEPFLALDDGDYWSWIWPIPIMLFLGEILLFPGDLHVNSLAHLISRFLSGATTILVCYSIKEDHRRLLERQTMLEQLADQRDHYIQMKTSLEDTRKEIHDFKHHMAAIHHFMDTDDKDGLREYCKRLYTHSRMGDQLPDTGNSAADGVIYRYMQLARQNEIRFEYQGIIQCGKMADVDLCILLGNALDNALIGCLTIPNNRRILVAAKKEGQLLSLMVKNTFDGVVEQKKQTILSRKRDNSPGVGIQSMLAVCRRYGAEMQTAWSENIFTVLFLIPLDN